MHPGHGAFTPILDVFQKALAHEKVVTSRIHDLVDQAKEENDQKVLNLLHWFVDEQIEEEDKFSTIVERVERIKDSWAGLYQYDSIMAERKLD